MRVFCLFRDIAIHWSKISIISLFSANPVSFEALARGRHPWDHESWCQNPRIHRLPDGGTSV